MTGGQRRRTERRSLEQRLSDPLIDIETPEHRARRPVARMISAVLEPVWYWLDLFGADDHPSNTKVVATFAVLTGLAVILVLSIGMARTGGRPDEWYVILVLGVIGGAAGWDYTKTRTKSRAALEQLRIEGHNGGSQ